MKKVIYSKYNSLRKTQFQIKTSIALIDGKKYVYKEAMNESALPQLDQMEKNFHMLEDLYEEIRAVDCVKEEGKLRFDFVEGKSLLAGIDFAHDDMDYTVERIKKAADIILKVKDKYKKPFEMSERFKELFTECNPQGMEAFSISNIDSIFSNFIISGDDIYCIDYEWVFDFDIPINYIKYRMILYLYYDWGHILGRVIEKDDFLKRFDLSEEEIALFDKMEACFQRYVHGENGRYIYVNNYAKENKDFLFTERENTDLKNINTDLKNENDQLKKSVTLMDQHIHNLDDIINDKQRQIDDKQRQIDEKNSEIGELNQRINNIKRGIKNPVFGFKMVISKIKNK